MFVVLGLAGGRPWLIISSPDEVAECLALPIGRVYALTRENEIPHLRFGRTLRFRAESIDRWLEESERGDGRKN